MDVLIEDQLRERDVGEVGVGEVGPTHVRAGSGPPRSSLAPINFTPTSRAPERSTFANFAPLRSDPRALNFTMFAPVKSALHKSASLNEAFSKFAQQSTLPVPLN